MTGRHRYKRRELELPDGGKLVLDADGSIIQTASDGSTMHAWSSDDPQWAERAFRFGIRSGRTTVTPRDRDDQGTDRPR